MVCFTASVSPVGSSGQRPGSPFPSRARWALQPDKPHGGNPTQGLVSAPTRPQGGRGGCQRWLGTRSRHAWSSARALRSACLVSHLRSQLTSGPACTRVRWDHHLLGLSLATPKASKLLPLMPQSTSCPKAFLWLDFMGLVTPSRGGTMTCLQKVEGTLSGKGISILQTSTQTSLNTMGELCRFEVPCSVTAGTAGLSEKPGLLTWAPHSPPL